MPCDRLFLVRVAHWAITASSGAPCQEFITRSIVPNPPLQAASNNAIDDDSAARMAVSLSLISHKKVYRLRASPRIRFVLSFAAKDLGFSAKPLRAC